MGKSADGYDAAYCVMWIARHSAEIQRLEAINPNHPLIANERELLEIWMTQYNEALNDN